MKKIKIAHILNSVGGVDVSLRLILENCNPNEFEHIIIHGKDDTKINFVNRDNKKLVDYKLTIQREISLISDLKAIYNTIKILKLENPDVVHAHSAKGGIIGRIATLFFKTKVLHTPQAYSYLSSPKGLKRTIFLVIEKLFKNINSILVASSPSELNRGINDVGYKKRKTNLFNNSINPIELDDLNTSVNLPSDFICSVGRPSFQKNIEMMVEVIREVKKVIPKIHLVVLGVGEYSPNKENIERLITTYALEENITLVPWIHRDEIFKIIKKSKFYISTARYEGLPYSIIESLALKKACVVTNSDGNRDLVKNEINGYVIEENDIMTMANCIFTLYHDDEKRKVFEYNAFESFKSNYNIENNILNIERIYKKYIN
ncbi:glycosyltransferase [Flavobacteriaceae bacterium]|jgi:glycosyltransferase involved in cell wall biosynthesis|nr:glycosyltransferase [Flavobacteriaceae bacterium]MDB3865866.1 glycosyltransferase [bacterium]